MSFLGAANHTSNSVVPLHLGRQGGCRDVSLQSSFLGAL